MALKQPLLGRLSKASRSRLIRRLGTLSGGMAIGQLVVLLTSPILTRLYDPDDFGLYAVFTALSGLLGAVLSLRYEIAIPLARTERQAADTAALSLVVALGLSLASVPLIWLGSDWLAQVTQMPGLTHILWLLPATMVLAGLAQFLNYWSVYRGTFRLNASSRIVQSVLQSALQVVLGALGAGPLGLVLGYAVAYGFRATNFILRLPRSDWALLRGARARAMRQLALEQWQYPALSAPSALLQNGTQLLPAVLLAALYGPAVAGWFGLGQRLIGLPVRLLGQAASQVFLGEIATSSRRDTFKLFKRASLAFLALGVGIMAPLLFAGPSLFALAFGEAWRTAGEITRLLVPLYLTRLVVAPVSQTLNAYGRQSQHLLTSGLSAAMLAGSFAIAWLYALEPLTTIFMFSVGSSLAYLLYFLLAYRAARSLANSQGEELSRSAVVDPMIE